MVTQHEIEKIIDGIISFESKMVNDHIESETKKMIDDVEINAKKAIDDVEAKAEKAIASLKAGLDQRQGRLETCSEKEFFVGLSHFDEATDDCGIKLFDKNNNIIKSKDLIDNLKLHTYYSFIMQFPDGDMFKISAYYIPTKKKIFNIWHRV